MSITNELQQLAEQHGHTTMVAKLKTGAWVIYVTPQEQDPMGSIMRATLEIEADREKTKEGS